MSPNQLYFLDCCRTRIKPSPIINEQAEKMVCQAKGFIDDKGAITPKGIEILNEFEMYLVKTKKKVTSEVLGPNFLEKVNEYRELFPPQRLPSKELARQSVKELQDKFVWFFKTYPEYDWDLVLDATEYYIHIKKAQAVPYMYMMTSSYFIKKTDPISRETRSVLADTCQELLENPNLN